MKNEAEERVRKAMRDMNDRHQKVAQEKLDKLQAEVPEHKLIHSKMYFKRDGTPYKGITEEHLLHQFSRDFKAGNRVKNTELFKGYVRISSVWLGMDHSLGMEGKPLIFETMVFIGGVGELTYRFSTEKETIEHHDKLVKAWNNKSVPFYYKYFKFKNKVIDSIKLFLFEKLGVRL